MTAQPQNVPNRRTQPVDGGALPTLFRVPTLDGGPNRAVFEPQPAEPPPVEAVAPIPPQAPAVVPPQSPEPESFERSDTSHVYGDLPELPPIDQPAGRSWAEAVGSRLVIGLLFVAVATVAVLGTRDVPPLANSSASSLLEEYAADDLDVEDGSGIFDPNGQVQVSEGEVAEDLVSENPRVIASQNVESPGYESLPSEIPSLDALPAMDQIDEEPNEEISFPQLPSLAGGAGQQTVDFDSLLADGEDATDKPSDESAANDETTDRVSVALNQPVYRNTSTPGPVTDWKQFYTESATVGFQEPIPPTENGAAPGGIGLNASAPAAPPWAQPPYTPESAGIATAVPTQQAPGMQGSPIDPSALGTTAPQYQGQRPTFGREPMNSQTVPHFGPSAGSAIPPGTSSYSPNPGYPVPGGTTFSAPGNPAYAAPPTSNYSAPGNPGYAAPSVAAPGYPANPGGIAQPAIPSQAPYSAGGGYSNVPQQPVTANYGSPTAGSPARAPAAPWQYPQSPQGAPSVSSNFQQALPLNSSQPQF